MTKYKLSEIEEQLFEYLQNCNLHDYLDILKLVGIVPEEITAEDIDIDN